MFQKLLSAGVLVLALCRPVDAGMTWQVYTWIKAGETTMTEVFEKAGPPDLIRESPLSVRIHLYYLGSSSDGDEKPTTVIVNGRTNRVISIERYIR